MYTAPNIFFPLSQTLQYKPTDGVGELHGGGFPYRNGTPMDSWDGLEAHGTEDDFLGITEWDGPTPLGLVPACAAPPVLAFGGESSLPPPPPALAFGGGATFLPRLPCYPWCERTGLPLTGVVTIDCPGLPAIDGFTFGVSYFPGDGNCIYERTPIFPDDPPFYFAIVLAEDDFPVIRWEAAYYIDSEQSWATAGLITTEDWACDPFTIVGEGLMLPEATPGSPTPIVFHFGSPATPAFHAGEIQFGGESSNVGSSPGDGAIIELGGETTNVAGGGARMGGLEFGGESSIRVGTDGGVEFGGVSSGFDADTSLIGVGGIEFGGNRSHLLVHSHSACGVEFGGISTVT